MARTLRLIGFRTKFATGVVKVPDRSKAPLRQPVPASIHRPVAISMPLYPITATVSTSSPVFVRLYHDRDRGLRRGGEVSGEAKAIRREVLEDGLESGNCPSFRYAARGGSGR